MINLIPWTMDFSKCGRKLKMCGTMHCLANVPLWTEFPLLHDLHSVHMANHNRNCRFYQNLCSRHFNLIYIFSICVRNILFVKFSYIRYLFMHTLPFHTYVTFSYIRYLFQPHFLIIKAAITCAFYFTIYYKKYLNFIVILERSAIYPIYY